MALAPGSSFGPYRVIEQLGHGGMASVYKAYEAPLDRFVALKVLPSEMLHDGTFKERFQDEARIVAKLEHSAIIPIFGYGINEGQPWMSMRLIAGGALSTLLKQRRLSHAEVVRIVRGVAEALAYAHGLGVVHRDVKPQNVLLDESGTVLLADFGIARMVEGGSALTRTGMITGTPNYMAPEQAMGKTVDHRCDVYALGVMAYEMLVGKLPFAADTPVAVLLMHVSDPLPLPSRDDVPEPLFRPVLRCLAKKPEDRWQQATEFAMALENGLIEARAPQPATVVDTLPTTPMVRTELPPPTAVPLVPGSAVRPARGGRRRILLGLTVAAVVAIGVAILALLFLGRSSAAIGSAGTTFSGRLVRWVRTEDEHRFHAPAGKQFYFRTVKYSDGMEQTPLRLIDEGGEEVFKTHLYADIGVKTLGRGGTYTLAVGGDAQTTGTYRLQVFEVPPPSRFDVALGARIGDGIPGPGAGRIATPGARNIYVFKINPGQDIYLRMVKYSEGMEQIAWRLLDEAEEEVFTARFYSGDVGIKTLSRGGTYTLEVGSDAQPATGAYSIQILGVPPPGRFEIPLGTRISDGVPGPGAGRISTPGARSTYVFKATPGQEIYVRMLKYANGMEQIAWRLLDEGETEVFAARFYSGDVGIKTLSRGGTYTLVVGSDAQAATGSYSIELVAVPPPSRFEIPLGTRISDGVPGPGAGRISTSGAKNIYTFKANPGQLVHFRMVKYSDGMEQIAWRLVDEGETEVFASRFYSGDVGNKTLTRGGTYTLVVGSDSQPATGTYSLEIKASP